MISTALGIGTVDVICVGVNNTQPNEELIEKVNHVIEEKKPIATNVLVKAPTEVSIATNLTVSMNPNTELNRQAIEEAVQRYFATLGIGTDFEPSALGEYSIRSKWCEVCCDKYSNKHENYRVANSKSWNDRFGAFRKQRTLVRLVSYPVAKIHRIKRTGFLKKYSEA